MVQLGASLSIRLGPLLKTSLSLMENVFKLSAKSVLIALGLKAATSVTDAAIQKKIFGSGMNSLGLAKTTIMNNIMKIVKPLEGAGLLIKDVKKKFKMKQKNKNHRESYNHILFSK